MNYDELLRRLRPLYRTYHKNQHGYVDTAYIDESRRQDGGPTGKYRTYERRPSIAAPDDTDTEDEVLDALHQRSSFTDGTTPRPVSKGELFEILAATYSVDSKTETRPVASAGQKYPLEIYPMVIDSPDLDSGLYHYNPSQNSLERPADPAYLEESFAPYKNFVTDNWEHLTVDHSVSVMLLITGIPSRATKKYGERGYMFTLIEVGAVIQAIQLAATRFGVGSRPYAGFQYNTVSELLGLIDHSREWVLTSVALAAPD